VGTISGRVTDSSTRLGIFNAQVTDATGTYSATTDPLGNYDIVSVAPGTYTLTASASGYNSASQTVVATNGGVTTASFSLVLLPPAMPTPTNTPTNTPMATSAPTATLMPTLTVPPRPRRPRRGSCCALAMVNVPSFEGATQKLFTLGV
jgi:iron complex outermembrane receptor protein